MATYYWVGGNGTWDASTTTNWSLSSGGAGGAGFPTAADNVIFNASSGASPVVTVTAAVALDCTIGAPTSGTLTFAFGASTLTLAGNFTCSTTISVTGTGTITLSASGKTFAGNGNTFYNLSFTATGFSANSTITGANTFNNLTVSSLASTNSIRFITLGANQTVGGTLTLGTTNSPTKRLMIQSDTLGTQRTVSVATMATLSDVDFRDIIVTGAAAPVSGTRLGNCLNNSGVTFVAGVNKYLTAGVGNALWNQGVWALTSGSASGSVNNFPLAQDTVILDNAGLGTGNSITIDYSWAIGSINGGSRTTAMTFTNSTVNAQIYGNLTFSSVMTVAGTGPLSFLGRGNTQQVTSAGKTFTQPWTINCPTGTVQLQDNCVLGSTLTVTLTAGTLDLNNLTLSAGLFSSNNSNTRAIAFGTGSINITSNNATVFQVSTATGFSYTGTPTINCTYSGATGTRNLRFGNGGGATEANSPTINITAGSDIVSFDGRAKNFTLSGFTGTFSNNLRVIYGNFIISSGTILTAGANTTTFAATSGTQQITTNGQTLDFPINFDGVGGIFAFQDALTQGSTRAFTVTNGTVQLKAGAISTVGAFATSGTTQKYLQSTIAGNQATLSQASGTVGVSYLTIQDINATGGATWNSFYDNNNVDAGNNTNWNFGGTPSYDAEYGYKLRSFTERGRL
jgi:hypothetical protein